MRNILLAIVFFCPVLTALNSSAGTWKRVDSATLQFLGTINSDEFDKFKKQFDNNVRVLEVTSGGGDTQQALMIAEQLEKVDLTIVVKTWCLSSCANYFFTAARTRIIEKGIVGFHGSISGCPPPAVQSYTDEQIKQMAEQSHVTEDQARVALKNYQLDFEQTWSNRELAFFKRRGVSPILFKRTCTADKGMNDGKEYQFLLPTPSTFRKYGYTNISGEQDKETIEWQVGEWLLN